MKNLSSLLVHLLGKNTGLNDVYVSAVHDRCLLCEEPISDSDTYLTFRVCPYCRFHYTLSARERIGLLADSRTFKESHKFLSSVAPLSFSNKGQYQEILSRSQARTGLTEAVVTGRAKIDGIESMLIVLDFGFMGGSMGSVVGEKVALALESAAKRDIPTVALVTGGGARIQEGVISLMQMAKTVSAANKLREKNVPFVVILANPSTGQAYASFANLADIIMAEPGSLIGLSPLRTLRQVSDSPIPFDSHTAESHLRHGLIDSIVDRENLQTRISTVLRTLTSQKENISVLKDLLKSETQPCNKPSAWQSVSLARDPERPSSLYYMRSMLTPFIELHGDRLNSDCRSIVGGVGFMQGKPVAIIGQQRVAAAYEDSYHTYPDGLRKAQRIIKLATKFNLPLITLIDTQGADPGLQAEEQGIGNAIANTLALMAEVPIPIVSSIIGESGSEGALALGISDRILMQEYSIYSPVSINRRISSSQENDPSLSRKAAEDLMLTSTDCDELGIVDIVVPEPDDGAHSNPQSASASLQLEILKSLSDISKYSRSKLLRERYKKYRKMGEMSAYAHDAMEVEVELLINIPTNESQNSDYKHDSGLYDTNLSGKINNIPQIELAEGI
ncbi:MAG: carboxyl transferase domain-containing protein [Chloroflexota bacterium]|nr:carboxyl transferase domain-containing protein [Chloroflexota bacterium]